MREIITYAPVEKADIHEITGMNNDAYPAVNKLSEREMLTLHGSSVFFRKAVSGDRICGFLLVLPSGLNYNSENYRWFTGYHDSFLYIDRVVIQPDFQGKGLGKELYRQLIDFAFESGARCIDCEVNLRPLNRVSLGFHRKLGFMPLEKGITERGTKTVMYLSLTL